MLKEMHKMSINNLTHFNNNTNKVLYIRIVTVSEIRPGVHLIVV